jgi:hypothetical protein
VATDQQRHKMVELRRVEFTLLGVLASKHFALEAVRVRSWGAHCFGVSRDAHGGPDVVLGDVQIYCARR